MSIESFKHKKDKRAFIPSKEEAGAESANVKVKSKSESKYPKNPIVHRGQDPELFWKDKYGEDDKKDSFNVDIRSLYRSEHISPETIIKNFYSLKENGISKTQQNLFEMFGNEINEDELQKVGDYYKHTNWTNRMILGDSLLIMNSLLEREGMAGKVQMVYIDPPYGIKYGSNWQMRLNNKNVKDGADDALSGEPEQIKAYRDTWELGIHSYLSYLRDRLIITKELLTESGSCFVQISDENVHLVRCLMDEVFGSENFVSLINVKRASVMFKKKLLNSAVFYVLYYSKNKELIKYRQLFFERTFEFMAESAGSHLRIESPDGKTSRALTSDERKNINKTMSDLAGWKLYRLLGLNAQGIEKQQPYEFENKNFRPPSGTQWKTSFPEGLDELKKKNRLEIEKNSLSFKTYLEDYPIVSLNNIWEKIGPSSNKKYVVETSDEIIKRCILMSTDPGDLVLDPTCGSGTTAYAAEQWGRRWITTDTSRIALNIAKTRLLKASYSYYKLYDSTGTDLRQGFIYKKAPHITLETLANNEPANEETLFDQADIDTKKMRVSGPFTVETLQNYNPLPPEELEIVYDKEDRFIETVFAHLKSAGVKNGFKNEIALFTRVEILASPYLNAEGFYNTTKGERKAYFHIGPKFGTVSRQAVNEAVKECRSKGDADWLIILGFSFESDIENESVTMSVGSFEVTKARMHDDLMQEGLLKKDKKAASFVTIGEPDIQIHKDKKTIHVEIHGLDIYDPIKDEVKARDIHDINFWMVDDDYDGSNFIVKQVFFCGGDKDEYDRWKKGLENLAISRARRNLEQTLKIEIDDEAFEKAYNHKSYPIEITKKNQKIAVKVVSQFGEESMKVIEIK